MTDVKSTTISNDEKEQDSRKINEKENLAQWALNQVWFFINKPWQHAFPELRVKNKFALFSLLTLFVGGHMTAIKISLLNSNISIFSSIDSNLAFWLISLICIGAVFFGLGLSGKISRLLALAIVAMFGYAAYVPIAELTDMANAFCGNNCSGFFEKMAKSRSFRRETFEAISAGFYVASLGLILVICCIVSPRYKSNTKLVNKLKEIASSQPQCDSFTQSNLYTSGVRLGKVATDKSVEAAGSLYNLAAKHKNNMQGDEKNVFTDEEKRQAFKSKLNTLLTKRVKLVLAALVVLILLFSLFSGDSVKGPDKNVVEQLIQKELSNQPELAVLSLFSKDLKITVTVDSVEDCEDYKFDDGDTGVACHINGYYTAMGESEAIDYKMIFFNSNGRWSYEGDL